MIYHETKHGVLYQGNSLDVLRSLADESVDCCVTSPPYWGLRDYGTATWVGGNADCDHRIDRFGNRKITDTTIIDQSKQKSLSGEYVSDGEQCPKCGAVRKDKQLGLERTPEEYVSNMVQLFREVRRVLKQDGTLWLNLGDSYAGSGHGYKSELKGKQATNKGTEFMTERPPAEIPDNLKPKDLVGIPWRVAFALQADGWYLRQDIIWHKPNPMPESVTDRCTKSHEYVFLMSKSAKYYFDSTAIKENCESVCTRKRSSAFRQQNEKTDETLTTVGRNKRSVWTVTTKPFKEAHFATFPRDLIRPMIQAGCPIGGIVLDSFMGSGTTAIEAIYQDKRYIGIELNQKYCDIAVKRIESKLDQTTIDL